MKKRWTKTSKFCEDSNPVSVARKYIIFHAASKALDGKQRHCAAFVPTPGIMEHKFATKDLAS